MRYRKVKQMICIFLAILLAWSGSWALLQAKEKQVQESLAAEVFRFHVIANSNSERDQALKMLVKEKVIAYMEEKSTQEMKDFRSRHRHSWEPYGEVLRTSRTTFPSEKPMMLWLWRTMN